MSETVRLTVAQAVVRFLGEQWSERDGERQRLFAGCLGIFGHGNVAGVGQALLEQELAFDGHEGDNPLPYVLARIGVSLLVSLLYTYPLHTRFVFRVVR